MRRRSARTLNGGRRIYFKLPTCHGHCVVVVGRRPPDGRSIPISQDERMEGKTLNGHGHVLPAGQAGYHEQGLVLHEFCCKQSLAPFSVKDSGETYGLGVLDLMPSH